ncbi:hypothetical protein SAY87_021045 [Trapa incisa]|uniref:Uncharacterized protein n=1 Tax=Trapa incisa TaxID=236973 RepID=A0AAN7JRF2_9MYRT|nr:hypothetical protein SAY87_021045 [Trapa incisa]
MGNCLFGGLGRGAAHQAGGRLARVITVNGGVLEFQAPVSAGSISDEFPGHGIFQSHDLFWKLLPYHEDLAAGESYYLLPFSGHINAGTRSVTLGKCGHIRSNSIPADHSSAMVTPYRMSIKHRGALKRSYTDVFSGFSSGRGGGGGRLWRVRLVISPEQFLEILSSEARTQELMDSMRAVAKCGVAGEGSASTMSSSSSSSSFSSEGFSDQWILSSSRNARSSKTDGLKEHTNKN